MLLRRGVRIPAEVRQALSLPAGERPLVGARDTAGRWYVGTSSALLVPDGSAYRRIPWESVERAEWERDGETLVLEEVAPFGEPQPRHRVELPGADRLLQLIRERVTASVVLRRFIPIDGKLGISLIGRRSPGTDGPVEWGLLIDPALSPDDPRVRTAAEQALAEAEGELGR